MDTRRWLDTDAYKTTKNAKTTRKRHNFDVLGAGHTERAYGVVWASLSRRFYIFSARPRRVVVALRPFLCPSPCVHCKLRIQEIKRDFNMKAAFLQLTK